VLILLDLNRQQLATDNVSSGVWRLDASWCILIYQAAPTLSFWKWKWQETVASDLSVGSWEGSAPSHGHCCEYCHTNTYLAEKEWWREQY